MCKHALFLPGLAWQEDERSPIGVVRDEAMRRQKIEIARAANAYLQECVKESQREHAEYMKHKEEYEERWAKEAESNGSGWVRPPADLDKKLAKWFTTSKGGDEPWPYKSCEMCYEDVTLRCDIGPLKKGQKLPYVCYNWKTKEIELYRDVDDKVVVTLDGI